MQSARPVVSINGEELKSWKTVSVKGSFKQAARSFSLVVAAEQGAQATHAILKSGSEVKITEGGETVFTGYIDRRQAHMGPQGPQTITASGRSKGQDAIDSSAKHKTGRFEKKTPIEIAKEIDPTKTEWSSDLQLDQVPEYQIAPGATVWREIERLCRDQNATLTSTPEGGIKITDASNAKRNGPLIEGQNVKEATADHNDSNRHSEYVVRGQSYDGHGKDALQIEATATDTEIQRKRPVIHVMDGNTDKKRAKKRAKHRRDRTAGNSRRAQITVPGWRDDDGALWAPGNKSWTESPFLDLKQDMLIESVAYAAEFQGGSNVKLTLVDPRAFNGKEGKAASSGDEWGMDTSDASED